jgi:hypothetical protein
MRFSGRWPVVTYLVSAFVTLVARRGMHVAVVDECV